MTHKRGYPSDGVTWEFSPDGQTQDAFLGALSDPISRAILRETTERSLTAAELSEVLDVPLSTTYRKLDRLVETPLVEETCRVVDDGKHPSQYRCVVDQIRIEISDETERLLDVYVSRRTSMDPDSVPVLHSLQ